ncbi:hypothetical protein Hdeb2414_s0009g00320551 [Helianthus debilis subsp. tardiflorus]
MFWLRRPSDLRRYLLKLNLKLIKQEGVGLRESILKVYKDVKVDVTVGSRVTDSGIKSDDVGSGGNSDLMKGNGDLDTKGKEILMQKELMDRAMKRKDWSAVEK